MVTQVAVELVVQGPRLFAELVLTENVSPHGARLMGSRGHRPTDVLQLVSLAGDLRSPAEVVYCQHLPDNRYAIGLKLLQPSGHWIADLPSTEEN